MIIPLHTPDGTVNINTATVTDEELTTLGLTRETLNDLAPRCYSTHFATVEVIDMALERPVRVKCLTGEDELLHDCYITEWVAEYYIQGHKLKVGDWVLVSFIENDNKKPVLFEKMYVTW